MASAKQARLKVANLEKKHARAIEALGKAHEGLVESYECLIAARAELAGLEAAENGEAPPQPKKVKVPAGEVEVEAGEEAEE